MVTQSPTFYASPEAEASFKRMAWALCLERDGYRSENWSLELGVRVSGTGDPMELSDYIASSVIALGRLQKVSPNAYKLVTDVIDRGWPAAKGDEYGHYNRWHRQDLTGTADRLGLNPKQSWPLVNAGLEALFQWLECDGVLPVGLTEILRQG